MNQLDPMSVMQKAMKRIEKGAFLTVSFLDEINIMTIGWAMFGIVWQKPILMVAIRSTRYTYTLIEKINNFTVSVPAGGMEKELTFCGTRSGRNCDKLQKCNLEAIDGRVVESPILKLDGIHFECRIVFKTAMEPVNLVFTYEKHYPKKDYHTLYFGEILDCYDMP